MKHRKLAWTLSFLGTSLALVACGDGSEPSSEGSGGSGLDSGAGGQSSGAGGELTGNASGGASAAGGASDHAGGMGNDTPAGGSDDPGDAAGGQGPASGGDSGGEDNGSGGSNSSGGASAMNCDIPTPASVPVGYGKSTTGGGNATPVVVNSFAEAEAALSAYHDAFKDGSQDQLVIQYKGTFNYASITDVCLQHTLDAQILQIKEMDNVTFIGSSGSSANFGITSIARTTSSSAT